MDIQTTSNGEERAKKVYAGLVGIVCSRDFTLTKALLLINKNGNKLVLFQQLAGMYQQTPEIAFRVNLLNVFQHVLSQQQGISHEIDERLNWVIMKIYEIRQEIDNNNAIDKEQLEILNKLLHMISNLIVFMSKVPACVVSQMSENSYFEETIAFIFNLSCTRPFNLLINHLFEANMFLKILEVSKNRPKMQGIEAKIIELIGLIEGNSHQYNQIIEEILVNTYKKAIKHIKDYKYYMIQTINDKLKALSNKSRLMLLVELKICKVELISQVICLDEHQLELYCQVIQNCFTFYTDIETREHLSQLWIENIYSLLKNGTQIDFNHIITDLEDELVTIIYIKVAELIEASPTPNDKRNEVLYIWAQLLLVERFKSIVEVNKNLKINVEVLLHRFSREMIGELKCSISPDIAQLVLLVYSRYFGMLLKQSQCRQLNRKIVSLIIRKYPPLIKEQMLAKEYCIINKEMINLEHYQPDYLAMLAKQCLQNKPISNFLTSVDRKISKIILKYIIQNNIIPMVDLIYQNDIVTYTVEHNIELHFSMYQHILQQKFYNNLEKYLLLISNNRKNIYRQSLNMCLYNVLMNQVYDFANRRLLKISEDIVIYVNQNIDVLFDIAGQQSTNLAQFFNALLSFIIRGLYYNIPFALMHLLIAILTLKKNIIAAVLEKEVTLIHQLVKFCKMYGSDKEYLLAGYECIMMVLYGLPSQSFSYQSWNDFKTGIFEANKYFLQAILQLFSGQLHFVDTFLAKKTKISDAQLYKKVIRKCLNVSMIRHLGLVINFTQEYSNQVKTMNKIIQTLINSEVVQRKSSIIPSNQSKKRPLILYHMEDQQNPPAILQPITKPKGSMHVHLLNYDAYDEFDQYRQLQQLLASYYSDNMQQQRISNYARVHGKVRAIYHVK